MYTPTIGIEVHVELKTNKKVFSHAKNNYNDKANTNVNEVDMAFPGVLPIVNKEVIEKSLMACVALNFDINRHIHFDRKNYYYPDLPKGYQITQDKTPIGRNGSIDMGDKTITIERMHIEEDTCKSIHSNGMTLLNFNRAGVPLIEIVSNPVIHSANDAMKYLEKLREILLYTGISDCKIEEGSMRADVNVSISKDSTLGTKVEVKNIGSIKDVGIAIDYEIERQTKELDKGNTIIPETRKYDQATKTTISMRKKEVGNDYRYFPEPDIPFIEITEDMIKKAKEDMPILPDEIRKIYSSKGIDEINIEKLINNKELSDYLNTFLDTNLNFKIASNLLLGDISFYLNKNDISINKTKLTKEKLLDLTNNIVSGKLSSKNVKDILEDVLSTDLSIKELIDKYNIVSLSNEEIEKIILKVLDENKESVEDYKNGKTNAIKFLIGMAIKESKGMANPQIVNSMLMDILNKN